MLGHWWQRLKPCSRPGPSPAEQARLERRVEDLQQAINKIAVDLAAITRKLAGQALDIHIDRVCIDKVSLDQLIFNIDGIGVKDLSGSLSIGLNYGGRVVRLGAPPASPGASSGQGGTGGPVKGPRPLGGGPPRVNFHSHRGEDEHHDQGT
ncbi:MAG: hypothetical protein PWQ18_1071 [Clostridia bacterium]|nr:hypothetical protein [Clostridia bacterium]